MLSTAVNAAPRTTRRRVGKCPQLEREHKTCFVYDRPHRRYRAEAPHAASHTKATQATTMSFDMPTPTHLNFDSVGDMSYREAVTFTEPRIREISNCAICHNVIQKARRACNQADHMFCQECIGDAVERGNLNTCPTCRQPLVWGHDGHPGVAAPIVDTFIDCAMVKCTQNGCDCTFPFKDLNKHLEYCDHVIVCCPYCNDGCAWKGKRADLEDHMSKLMGKHTELLLRKQSLQFASLQDSIIKHIENVAGRSHCLQTQRLESLMQMWMQYPRMYAAPQQQAYAAQGMNTQVNQFHTQSHPQCHPTGFGATFTEHTPPTKKHASSPAAPGAPGPSARGQR